MKLVPFKQKKEVVQNWLQENIYKAREATDGIENILLIKAIVIVIMDMIAICKINKEAVDIAKIVKALVIQMVLFGLMPKAT